MASAELADHLVIPPEALTQHTKTPASPPAENVEDSTQASTQQKKKKKKKSKKSNQAKTSPSTNGADSGGPRQNVLCISRNKHWRYISSYHGAWLQLPVELLDSLLQLNQDPATFSPSSEMRFPALSAPGNSVPSSSRARERSYPANLEDYNLPADPLRGYSQLSVPAPIPTPKPGKATPPPIDPGVFRSVNSIRRLIDEAAELSVRASSGMSSAELRTSNALMMGGSGAWAAAQTLGLGSLGGGPGNGRNVAMSAMRVHRLRALAVQKLAQAYKADEIASSVMVMQGGSVFDDVAERVLKVDPNDADAKYVHFFHEKIPSRQLAESTTTQVLDELIRANPQNLEYYRTRGIVHCFRDEYPEAVRDFTFALKESRAQRKARMAHRSPSSDSHGVHGKAGRKKKGKANGRTNGQASPDSTSIPEHDANSEPALHPSASPDAADPIEPQLLFLRGAAHLQHAVFLIESTVLDLEGVQKAATLDGAELRLCYLEDGKYGGVEIGHPNGPLGPANGQKAQAYRRVLSEAGLKENITALLQRAIRDLERFIGHFDSIERASMYFDADKDLSQRVEYAFTLLEAMRPGVHTTTPLPPAAMYTTYHPLLVEAHFTILLCELMLGNFSELVPAFVQTAALVDGLEGYPVFVPPRSMAQAEFMEILERLAGGWRNGIQPHSLDKARSKGRLLTIEEDMPPPSPTYYSEDGDDDGSASSSSGSPILSSSASVSSVSTVVPGSGSVSPEPSASGSSSSSYGFAGSSAGASSSFFGGLSDSPMSSPRLDTGAFERAQAREDAVDKARILLTPVARKQRERFAEEKANGGKKKTGTINIPLHGPRLEVMLAWVGAVHIPELDGLV